jgi:hypothetical protein
MLIGVEKRFVFVANSKTASTSIERALLQHAEIHRAGTPQRKHIPLRTALREYRFLFGRKKYAPETFFKFGVMRDPADWIQSWYRYRKGNTVAHPISKETTFEDFWKDWLAKPEKPKQKRQQKKFFVKVDGNLIADYIIPYPELDSHFATITNGLGIEAQLANHNVSKIKSLDDSLSDATLTEIRTHFAEDYALFNRLNEINEQGLEHLQATRPE